MDRQMDNRYRPHAHGERLRRTDTAAHLSAAHRARPVPHHHGNSAAAGGVNYQFSLAYVVAFLLAD